MSSLYFKQLQLGPMQNFVYLIGDPVTRTAAVVDAAWDIDRIVAIAAADDMRLTAALATHFHPDHLGGDLMGHHIHGAAELLQRNLELKVYLHKSEVPFAHRIASLSSSDIVSVDSGDDLALGGVKIKFIHTPGHTPGSQCFLVDGRLISGDTLFVGSCGRVDLPGSDPAQLYDSLVNKLKRLPEDTVLYPGHDYSDRPTSTIAAEKRHNPYLRFDRLEDFLGMMGY
ncbi:MAG: MBL fold metallo-hydrolase [Deltaproteobacteria bacterium]|nr:MBL fold metallo-hydrolase [Deltaproteobacteria bacterium]